MIMKMMNVMMIMVIMLMIMMMKMTQNQITTMVLLSKYTRRPLSKDSVAGTGTEEKSGMSKG